MHIQDNILKHALKHVRFINGTAYAGKSTMCRMLAERYDMILCGENYCADQFMAAADPALQPNMYWFRDRGDDHDAFWQRYVSRTPEEYDAWVTGTSREMAGFEIAELLRLSGDRLVMVDTNIPTCMLRKIADPHQIAFLLSPQSLSVDRFFDRDDPDKQFVLGVLQRHPNPDWAMRNFRAGLALINSKQHYDEFLHSGFFTVVRQPGEGDTREQTMRTLARHFQLTLD